MNELIATGQYGRLFAVVHFASVNDYGTVLPARTPAEVVPRY